MGCKKKFTIMMEVETEDFEDLPGIDDHYWNADHITGLLLDQVNEDGMFEGFEVKKLVVANHDFPEDFRNWPEDRKNSHVNYQR